MNPTLTLNVAELYPRLDPKLRRVVQSNLEVPDCVVEDACQIAWTLLITDPPELGEPHVFGWLATTARREALRILRRAATELRVVEEVRPEPGMELEDPHGAAEFWDRLAQLRRLSRRQQRIVWMSGLGYRHAEIAEQTGESLRSVERQLTVARKRLDSVA